MKSLERGRRKQKTAQVPQAHHLAKVLDFLKEPKAGGWAAERECSWEVPISGRGRELVCVGWGVGVCTHAQQGSGRDTTATFIHIVNESLFQLHVHLTISDPAEVLVLLVLSLHKSTCPLSTSIQLL